MLLRMSKDSWTVIGTGIALAALLLQQAGSLRADIRDVRQEVRDVRQDVREIHSDLARSRLPVTSLPESKSLSNLLAFIQCHLFNA